MTTREALLEQADAAARAVHDHARRCPACARNDIRWGSNTPAPLESCAEFYRLRWEGQRSRFAYERALYDA